MTYAFSWLNQNNSSTIKDMKNMSAKINYIGLITPPSRDFFRFIMATGHVFYSGNFPRCDKCKKEDSTTEIRPCDEMQCDSCWYEKDDEHKQLEEISSDGPDDGLTDVETTSPTEALKPGMPLASHPYAEGNEVHNGSCPDEMMLSSQHKFLVVIKNSNETTENCVKCKKKLINGVRCYQCGKGLHWRCGGVSKDEVKDEIITQNYWNCIYCRMTDKNCPSCSLKEKEIKELKLSCVELEKSIKKLKHELKVCNEKHTDAEDRLTRERKLRKRTEDELMELQEMHAYNSESSISSDVSCSNSSDESENENGKRKKSARSGRSARKVRGRRQSSKRSASDKKSTFTERPLVKNQWNPERGPIRKPEENEENMTKGRPYRKDKNKMCDPKLCSKSTVDHKRCESEENPDLLRPFST